MMRRGAIGAVLGVVLLACTPHAEADQEWIKKLTTDYANGHLEAVEQMAQADTLERASADAAGWGYLAEGVWKYTPNVSRVRPKEAGVALDALAAKAVEARTAHADVPQYGVAWAWLTMARCRHQRIVGEDASISGWVDAAGFLLTYTESPESTNTTDFRLMSATSLVEAAAMPKSDCEELLARSRGLLDLALAEIQDEDTRAAALADWHAAVAQMHLLRRKKGDAKKAVAAGVAALAPRLEASDSAASVRNAHQRLAGINAQAKLKVKGAEFRTVSKRSSKGALLVEIPESGLWTFAEPEGTMVLRLYQTSREGARVREFHFVVWPTGTNLELSDGRTVATSDPKVIAKALCGSLGETCGLTSVKNETKPKKIRLHKDFSDAYHAQVDGLGRQGNWIRAHSYLFRSKKQKYTYKVVIYQMQVLPEEDGALDFVLSNVRLAKEK